MKTPRRAVLRPLREDWEADELMTLAEAVAVFYPRGPLTETSLRTAVANGSLTFEKINGRLFVTPTDLKEMRTRCRVDPEARGSTSASAKAGPRSGLSSTMEDLKRAQAVTLATVRELRERYRGTSSRNGRQPSARTTPAT